MLSSCFRFPSSAGDRSKYTRTSAEVAASSPTELTKTAQNDLGGTHLAWAKRALPARFLW